MMQSTKKAFLVLVLAAAGGVVSYLLFRLALSHGMIPLALPGGGMGLAAGVARGPQWVWPSLLIGAAALVLGAYCYWKLLTGAQYSFLTFLSHLGDLSPFHLVLLALGGFIGFWIPFRRRGQKLG